MIKENISNSTRQLKIKADNLSKKIMANKLMVRTFISSTLFMVALGIFASLVNKFDVLIRWAVVLYGVGIIAFFLFNILNYLTLISRTAISKSANFPLIMFLNTFLGFISQLFFFNLALAIIIRLLAFMPNFGTFGCEVRCSIVHYYYNTRIYDQVSNMIWWLTLATIIAFMVGNYLIWIRERR